MSGNLLVVQHIPTLISDSTETISCVLKKLCFHRPCLLLGELLTLMWRKTQKSSYHQRENGSSQKIWTGEESLWTYQHIIILLEINNNFARKLFSLRVNTLKGNIILTGGYEDDGSDEGQLSDKVCRKEKK